MSTLTQSMRLPADLLVELGEFTGKFWSSWEQEPFICEAIRAYITPAAPDTQQSAMQPDEGYQWKQVFLPHGTRLRASFGRQPYFATVENSEIKCDGQSVSPSAFANLRGSGNRNAWKAVWLRFPGSAQWVLADACRTLQKTAVARRFGAEAPEPAPRPRQSQPAHPAVAPIHPAGAAVVPGDAVKRKKKSGRAKRHKHGRHLP